MATIKSIEEKAKAYDRAIEELRGLLECIHEDKCDIMEEDIIKIFPELIESEDERVRKELLSFFIERAKYTEDSTFNGLSSKEIISWLEKQGEQKPQGKSVLEAINEEKVDNANKVEPQDELTEFEKAVKQVLEEAIECGDTHNLKADAEMLLSLAHNSSWNEEDKKMFLDIECLIHSYRTGSYEYELSSWLEHLKDRVKPQQQEWSEEDEKRIKNIISVLDVQVCWDGATGKKGNPYQKEIEWLKSLKERYTWKPSDEQIKAQ